MFEGSTDTLGYFARSLYGADRDIFAGACSALADGSTNAKWELKNSSCVLVEIRNVLQARRSLLDVGPRA